MSLHRRRVLATAAAVPLAATAGCTGPFGLAEDGDARSPPQYARWVPANSGAATETGEEGSASAGQFYVYVDWAGIEDLERLESDLPTDDAPFEGTPGGDTVGGDADPMIAVPVVGVVLAAFGAGLQLGLYGFPGALFDEYVDEAPGGSAIDPTPDGTPTDGAADVGRLESMVLTTDAIVLRGSYDLDAVETAATDREFERTGTYRDAVLYEGEGGLLTPQGLAFAAREDALVFGNPSVEDGPGDGTATDGGAVRGAVETTLDVEAGQEPRLADRSDDAAWALGRAGAGHVAVGAWGGLDAPEGPGFDGGLFGAGGPTPTPIGTAEGQVYSLTLTEEAVEGDMAGVYADGDVPERAAVEKTIGTTAEDREITIDGRRVAVTGTWPVTTGQNS